MEELENPGRLFYINEINQQLARLASWAEISAHSNRTDISIISEEIICGLLNLMYRDKGWQLVNANSPEHHNTSGVDLVDDDLCIAVQVTAKNRIDKVNDMLAKFHSHGLDQQYDKLIMVVLTSHDPTPGMKKKQLGCFDGSRDIWNMNRLMREIQHYEDISYLAQIAAYLDEQVGSLYKKPTASGPQNEKANHRDSASAQKDIPFYKRILSLFMESDTDDNDSEPVLDEDHHDPEIKVSVFSRFSTWIDSLLEATAGCLVTSGIVMIVLFILAMVLSNILPMTKMPTELAAYSVTINGSTIQIPTTFAQMETFGWVAADNEKMETLVDPNTTSFLYFTDLTNGHGTMTVQYANPSNHTLQVKDCVIYELSITQKSFDNSYTGESVNTLTAPGGLTMGSSKWSERTLYELGYKKERSSYEISYRYVLENGNKYVFIFDKKTKFLSGVRIRNWDDTAMDKLTGTEYDSTAPAYDAESLNNWIGATMFITLDGYQFPVGCPVPDYLELGYTLDKSPEYVTSREHSDIYFRGDALHLLSGQVYNPFPRALTTENCFIGCIDTRNIESASEQFILTCQFDSHTLTLPKGMDRNKLISELDTHGITWIESGLSSITFYPNSLLKTVTVTCIFSESTQALSNIQVDSCDALQDYFFDLTNAA